MIRAVCIVTFLFILLNGARADEFAALVRDLNVLQNRMVTGDADARDAAARQFDVIDKEIGAVEPEGWADERNQRAAIVYLLCGGAAPGLREIHEADFFAGKLAPLLGASIEYAEGGNGGLPEALMNFDARHLPPMLGGHLALVQGSAVIGENPARAIALFDLARLLMPGSLVEEAALRREIAILDPVRDVSKLALLSARYVSKYAASPYARNFWDVLRRATIGDPDFLPRAPRFEPIFAKGPAAERVGFGLAVARMAILAGKFDEAQRLVDNASKTATHPLTLKRITAYRNIIAALIQEKSQQNPSPPDVSELDKQDHALVEIASSVKSGLEKREAGTADTQQDGDYQIAASVRQALAKSDELLKRAEPQ